MQATEVHSQPVQQKEKEDDVEASDSAQQALASDVPEAMNIGAQADIKEGHSARSDMKDGFGISSREATLLKHKQPYDFAEEPTGEEVAGYKRRDPSMDEWQQYRQRVSNIALAC